MLQLQVAQILGHDLVRKVLELFTEELTKFAHELHSLYSLYYIFYFVLYIYILL